MYNGPNHSLQRTAPHVTFPASTAAFPPAMQGAERCSAVGELEVVRRVNLTPLTS